jgi:hypothetical protein
VSARIDEIGVRTRKMWLKQGSRSLFARILKVTGANRRKLRAKTKIN